MNYCNIENKLCSIATNEGKCPVSACIKKNETIYAIYKESKKVWPPEDPVNIHDEISKGFDRIENVIREESAKMAEIIRQAILQPEPQPQVVWTNYIPEACRSCSNHPSNGGTGMCHCTLGSPKVTSGVIFTEDDKKLPSSYSTSASTDCPGR